MIVNVTNTVKNVIMVFIKNGNISQSVVTLNSGMMMKAEYVQKQEDNKANVHLINGTVLLNIDRDSLGYDKKANNEYISRKENVGHSPVETPGAVQDPLPKPAIKRRRGCCGG